MDLIMTYDSFALDSQIILWRRRGMDMYGGY